MPSDPLVPYTDLVTTGSDAVDGTGDFTPVGIQSAVEATPIMPAPLSQEAWTMMDPASQASYISQLVTGEPSDDDDEGNFEEDSGLDTSQVESGGSYTVPVPPVAQLPGSEWRNDVQPKGPNGYLSSPDPIEDDEKEARDFKDDIGYRYSEFVKGLGQRFNHLFGMDEGGDAGREHFQNAFNPDHDEPPGLPVSEAQIGLPKGSYAEQAGVPQTIAAPGGNSPVSLYSEQPQDWQYVSDDPQRAARILSVAESMIGSSVNPGHLVQRAYAAAGIETSDLIEFQLEMGERVPLNELKPGDLVGWSDSPDSMFRDNVGVMLTDGTVIRDGRVGEQARVFDLHTLPRKSLYGVRIKNDSNRAAGSRVTLNAAEQAQVRQAMEAVHKVLSGVFGGMLPVKPKPKKKSKSNNSGGGKKKSSGGKKGGNRDAGSKFYGSEKKDSGNSSQKYSGIGATK